MAAAAAATPKDRGALIVFEGVDRSGKTTQSTKLVERIKLEGGAAIHMRFPDRTTPIGKMIDAYLKGDAKDSLNDQAIHLLFAANRWECRDAIMTALKSGATVVCDRYVYSGIAYSGAKGLATKWCAAPEMGLPSPDLTLFLCVDTADSAARSGFGTERFETTAFQARVVKEFASLCAGNAALNTPAPVVMDGSKEVNLLHAEIYAAYLKTIGLVSKKAVAVL